MELLTESQRKLVLEFKEKVKLYEIRQKSGNIQIEEKLLLKQSDQRAFKEMVSPERELNPNTVLKTVIFNNTPSKYIVEASGLSPGKTFYPHEVSPRGASEEKYRLLLESRITAGQDGNLVENRSFNATGDIKKQISKQILEGSTQKNSRSDDSHFLTNETYSEKLECYLKEQDRTLNRFRQSEGQRLIVPSIRALEVEEPEKIQYNSNHPRYKSFQIPEKKLFEELIQERASLKQRSLNFSTQSSENIKSYQSISIEKPGTRIIDIPQKENHIKRVGRSHSNLKKIPLNLRKRNQSRSNKKVTFMDQPMKRESSTKSLKLDSPERQEQIIQYKISEIKSILDDLFRKMRLGTFDNKKFYEIMEDQMYFSKDFTDKVKTLVRGNVKISRKTQYHQYSFIKF